jgi:hypothetical protein
MRDEETHRDRILSAIRTRTVPLDDDQLSAVTGIRPRQTVNQICRRLAAEGMIGRGMGADGKLVSWIAQPVGGEPQALGEPVIASGVLGESATGGPALPEAVALASDRAPGDVPLAVLPGSSGEQRRAEGVMLAELGALLGVPLAPGRIQHPSGTRVELDGVSPDRSVLVECWAHHGPAKPAQKNKLMVDGVKLHWIAQSLPPVAARRLVLCVGDELAVRHLANSWQGQAIAELGVEICVVRLPDDLVQAIRAAQERQFR